MNDYIDIYCERLEPGLWAEPLNAVTNVAFFVAALCALMLARKRNALDLNSGILISLVIVIGTGSTLFHTLATGWAQLSDVLPILFYQIVFIILYARNVMKLGTLKTACLLGGFFATVFVFQQLPQHWLNGSLGYAPALLFVLGLGVWHLQKAAVERFGLLAAGVTFIVSLIFRSIDMQICETLPIGTHFIWHTLNGCVLYLTTRAYVVNTQNPQA